MSTEIKNATVESTRLGGYDGHVGILSAWLYLDYGGSSQGFGGHGLDEPIKDAKGKFLDRQGSARGMEFIRRILTTLDVESWENLPGTPLRVVCEHSKVHAIGHYLKDKWFYPDKDLDHLKAG